MVNIYTDGLYQPETKIKYKRLIILNKTLNKLINLC